MRRLKNIYGPKENNVKKITKKCLQPYDQLLLSDSCRQLTGCRQSQTIEQGRRQSLIHALTLRQTRHKRQHTTGRERRGSTPHARAVTHAPSRTPTPTQPALSVANHNPLPLTSPFTVAHIRMLWWVQSLTKALFR